MGLFGTSDPIKKEEKLIDKEAKSEEKQLKQALKDVDHAQDAEEKGAKKEHHAQSSHEKAAKEMAKAQSAFEKAQHEFEAAKAKEAHSAKEYEASVNEHQRLHQATEQAKAAADRARHDHHSNNAERESKLASLAAQADIKSGKNDDVVPVAPVAGAGTGAVGTGVPATADPSLVHQHNQGAGFAQQEPLVGQTQQPTGYAAQPTEGQQVHSAVKHM